MLLGVVGCLAGVLALGAGPALGGGPALATTASFTTKGCSTWSAPVGVTSVHISAVASAGASGSGGSIYVTAYGAPGDGVSATLALAPGQTLDVCVDSGGGTTGTDGGAGGGASGVSAGSSFSDPMVVAGGGGGEGAAVGGGCIDGNPGGGSPGLPAGADGGLCWASGGGGGTDNSVGTGGGDPDPTGDGGDGSAFSSSGPGAGGSGGSGTYCVGGGGGAGYYGGGGGGGDGSGGNCPGGGGGGGSDFCSNSASLTGCTVSSGAGTQTVAGSATGDAQVVLTYTVAAAPSVLVTAPANGATYTQGQVLDSSFSCTDGAGGSGIASCVDQSGHTSGAALDTSTVGSHTFTVTTTSRDGLSSSTIVTYIVSAPPTNTVTPQLIEPRVVDPSLGSKSFTAKAGTTIKLKLSTAASAKVVITESLPGHKFAGVCNPLAKKGSKCTLTNTVKTLQFGGVSGANSFKLNVKGLKPGAYTATLTASDSAGTSNEITLKFKIRK